MNGDYFLKTTTHIGPTKRIGLSVWKDSRKHLVMHLQEWDRKPDEPGWETMALFQAWSTTAAREPAPRATKNVVRSFILRNLAVALATADARAAVLAEGGHAVEKKDVMDALAGVA